MANENVKLLLEVKLNKAWLSGDVIAERMHARINDTKKTAKCTHDIEDLKYCCRLIQAINQLPEYAVAYNGVQLSDIKIPSFMKELVWPSKVSFKPGSKYPDLRKVTDIPLVDVDLQALKRLSDTIGAEFKTEISVQAIKDMRDTAVLNDTKVAVWNGESWVIQSEGEDDICMPVPVVDWVYNLYGSHILNESAEYVINQWFNRIKFA